MLRDSFAAGDRGRISVRTAWRGSWRSRSAIRGWSRVEAGGDRLHDAAVTWTTQPRPLYPEVQIVRVPPRPDFFAEISRGTTDKFRDPRKTPLHLQPSLKRFRTGVELNWAKHARWAKLERQRRRAPSEWIRAVSQQWEGRSSILNRLRREKIDEGRTTNLLIATLPLPWNLAKSPNTSGPSVPRARSVFQAGKSPATPQAPPEGCSCQRAVRSAPDATTTPLRRRAVRSMVLGHRPCKPSPIVVPIPWGVIEGRT